MRAFFYTYHFLPRLDMIMKICYIFWSVKSWKKGEVNGIEIKYLSEPGHGNWIGRFSDVGTQPTKLAKGRRTFFLRAFHHNPARQNAPRKILSQLDLRGPRKQSAAPYYFSLNYLSVFWWASGLLIEVKRQLFKAQQEIKAKQTKQSLNYTISCPADTITAGFFLFNNIIVIYLIGNQI
ncbi:MAG: hypothetical protein K2X37_08815 [Chitinophagaceae bacterium]|nr:hypothetical protein [Chitinophagaceae bacterium]